MGLGTGAEVDSRANDSRKIAPRTTPIFKRRFVMGLQLRTRESSETFACHTNGLSQHVSTSEFDMNRSPPVLARPALRRGKLSTIRCAQGRANERELRRVHLTQSIFLNF